MTNKSFAKGCVIKKDFLSKEHAESFLKRFKGYHRAYKCDFCSFWHTTTQLPRTKHYCKKFDFNERFDKALKNIVDNINT